MDGNGPGAQSVCMGLRCSMVFDGTASHCPHCGARAITLASLRRRGWLLVGLGVFLLAIMGTVLWFTVPLLLANGAEVDGSRFTGKQEDLQLVVAVFAAVIVFGIGALVNGLAQAIWGRRLRWVIAVMLALAAALLALGYMIRRGIIT